MNKISVVQTESKDQLDGSMGKCVGDWFSTYLGYLQYVSRCTNVWFMLVHLDVPIGRNFA